MVALYKKKGVQNRLFNLNVRLPLTSGKVNPVIAATASGDDADRFFYYNNGVSAVCSDFALDGNSITANRFQIINGAQTVNALVKASKLRQGNLDAYVLFRLTQTDEPYGGDFTESVIRFNNTQNPVKAADFFSNDPVQRWLAKECERISGRGPVRNFYYVNKSGRKPKGATGRGYKIEMVAGVRHAFLYGPVISYREPATFFDRNERYWEAFGIDGQPCEFWPEESLYELGAALAIHDRVQEIGTTLKRDDKTKDTDRAKFTYRLARYITGMVAAGLRATKGESFNDYSTLIASSKTFSEHVDPIIATSLRVLAQEYSERKKRAVQPEYNLARDEETWIDLRDRLVEEILSEQVLGYVKPPG